MIECVGVIATIGLIILIAFNIVAELIGFSLLFISFNIGAELIFFLLLFFIPFLITLCFYKKITKVFYYYNYFILQQLSDV